MKTMFVNNYLEKCRMSVMSGDGEKVNLMQVNDGGVFCFGMTPTQAREMAAALVLHADAVEQEAVTA